MRSDLFFCLSFGVFQHHLYRAAPGQVAFEFVAATGDCFNRLYWHELSRPAQIYSECALHCGSHTAARLLHSFQVFQYSHRIARTFFLQPFFLSVNEEKLGFLRPVFFIADYKIWFRTIQCFRSCWGHQRLCGNCIQAYASAWAERINK